MISKVFQLYQKFHGRCTISFFFFSLKVFLLFAHKAQKQESAIKLLWVNIILSFYYSATLCVIVPLCACVSLSHCLSLSLTLCVCLSLSLSVSQSLNSVSFSLILFLNLPSFLFLSYIFRLFTISFL